MREEEEEQQEMTGTMRETTQRFGWTAEGNSSGGSKLIKEET